MWFDNVHKKCLDRIKTWHVSKALAEDWCDCTWAAEWQCERGGWGWGGYLTSHMLLWIIPSFVARTMPAECRRLKTARTGNKHRSTGTRNTPLKVVWYQCRKEVDTTDTVSTEFILQTCGYRKRITVVNVVLHPNMKWGYCSYPGVDGGTTAMIISNHINEWCGMLFVQF